ncbi:tyrosine-type recombinase/integrase [Methylobacter tundripaludum]|uniref:tyrosine-type recombinase/integrase n=1 Tax=Methylobacter tundripaludum TaxID=173365 RepID=UPI0004DF991A|nr:site-specific integrase [Methylobacter tundripaludum]
MATITERTAKDGTTRYRSEIRLKGYPTQSATFKRKTDAKKWIQDTESAIREGRHFKTVEAKKHTVDEMIDRYLSGAKLTKVQDDHTGLHLRRWKEEIGYMLLADVNADAITLIKEKLLNEEFRGKPRSPTTVLRYMASLSTVFTTAVRDWAWLEDSPMKNIKKPTAARGRVRFLSDAERERLLIACKESRNKQLYMCVILAISTGMRQAELFGLKWADVNLKERYIILHETKNGERRRVPLAGLVLELLQEHAKVRRLDTPLLFPGIKNPLTPIDLQTPWETARKNAGITDFTWHDLRHCTASYLAMNGASLAEIAEILGHKTLSMVKRYAHLSDGHVSSVIESMNAKIFGGV